MLGLSEEAKAVSYHLQFQWLLAAEKVPREAHNSILFVPSSSGTW